MRRFEVKRKAFEKWRLAEPGHRDLLPGELRLAVECFAFTANNLTYAAAGDLLGYWQFFPTDDPEQWGVIPVWGCARVVASATDALGEGERLFGYLPPAEQFTLRPVEVGAAELFDGSEHRQALPPLYNRYRRLTAAQPERAEMLQALLGPLYSTGYCLWDQLHQNQWYGAQQVVIISASSKTSLGLAEALAEDERAPAVVGMTSARNAAFVGTTGLYTEVLSYDGTGALPARPSVVVDMAGNAATAEALRVRLGDNLRYYISVGLTHWDRAGDGPGQSQERHEWFFAPSYMLERGKALAPGEFARRAQGFVGRAADRAASWLTLEQAVGLQALAERYPAICAGDMDPAVGLICRV
jgi:hypothetical protein